MRERLPLALSASAVLIAAMGVTRASEGAAPKTVRAAVFATDASTVNGLRVARSPRPGQLLALDKNARYPRAVIPATVGDGGPIGAQGARGLTGPPGETGGFAYFTQSRSGQGISRFEEDRTMVAEIDELPAGSWLLYGAVSAGAVRSPAAPVGCSLVRRNMVLASSRTTPGRGNGGLRLAGHLAIAAWSSDVPATIRLDCGVEQRTENETGAERIWLSAIRVGSVDVERQDP